MALITVNLTDTFDEWRIKTNTLGAGIVFDISPQLGGNLDLNSNDITGTGNINFTGILTSTSIAGTVAGTTQSVGNNSTLLATTAFVTAAVQLEDTLAEMNDTTISSPANLEILQYTGSVWENKTASAAGLPTLGFTIAMAVALG